MQFCCANLGLHHAPPQRIFRRLRRYARGIWLHILRSSHLRRRRHPLHLLRICLPCPLFHHTTPASTGMDSCGTQPSDALTAELGHGRTVHRALFCSVMFSSPHITVIVFTFRWSFCMGSFSLVLFLIFLLVSAFLSFLRRKIFRCTPAFSFSPCCCLFFPRHFLWGWRWLDVQLSSNNGRERRERMVWFNDLRSVAKYW